MPRETFFKARARYNDDEERERERTSSSSSSSKARSVFLSPLFKTTLRKTRPKEQRKKKRTDANNAAVVAAVTAALESFSDKLDAWTTVLLTELLCCFDDDEEHKDKRGECEYTNIERRMPSSIFPLQSRPKKKSVLYKTKKKDNRNSTRNSITRRSNARTVWRKPCLR